VQVHGHESACRLGEFHPDATRQIGSGSDLSSICERRTPGDRRLPRSARGLALAARKTAHRDRDRDR